MYSSEIQAAIRVLHNFGHSLSRIVYIIYKEYKIRICKSGTKYYLDKVAKREKSVNNISD
jgi:hypothetical protein